MKIEKYKEYAPLIARLSISLVFLWFGFNEILNTEVWVTWLPQFAYNLPIAPTTLVLINGTLRLSLADYY